MFKHPNGHENPEEMPFEKKEFMAKNVHLGAFVLPQSLISAINNYEPVELREDTVIPESMKDKAQLYKSEIYLGYNPSNPEIGDTRVSFMVVKPVEASIIAKQIGNTFEPYISKAGGKIEILRVGTYSAETMFKQAEKSNKLMTWFLRALGFVIMFIGFSMILSPLSVVADVVPIIGSIVEAGTGIIAFIVSAILSIITIAIAWLFYRPVIGIILFTLSIALAIALKIKLKKHKTS